MCRLGLPQAAVPRLPHLVQGLLRHLPHGRLALGLLQSGPVEAHSDPYQGTPGIAVQRRRFPLPIGRAAPHCPIPVAVFAIGQEFGRVIKPCQLFPLDDPLAENALFRHGSALCFVFFFPGQFHDIAKPAHDIAVIVPLVGHHAVAAIFDAPVGIGEIAAAFVAASAYRGQ